MLGISFAKILLLVLVVAGVWFGFKYLSRADTRPKERVRSKPGDGGDPAAVEDMVRCAVCGAYQARGAGPCQRQDCPARS
jgi:uncharacterized protein